MMSVKLFIIIIELFFYIEYGLSMNESNILRLGKSLKSKIEITIKNVNENNNNDTDNIDLLKPKGRAISFSKNNPELDWKKYLKNVVDKNEEVPRDLDLNFMSEKIVSNGNSIQWLNDLYDPLKWTRVPGKLTDNCRNDMEGFLFALKNGKLWAAKSKIINFLLF